MTHPYHDPSQPGAAQPQLPAVQYPPISAAPGYGGPVSGPPGQWTGAAHPAPPGYVPANVPRTMPLPVPYSAPPRSPYPMGPGYAGFGHGPQPVVVVQQPQNSGVAVASMVLGIIGLVSGCCSFGIPSLLAIGFGHAGLAATRDGRTGGRGMAVAGLTMGYIVFVPAVLFSIYMVFAGGMAALGA